MRGQQAIPLLAAALAAVFCLQAGGPLRLIEPGQPFLWPGDPPTLVFRPDAGSMGALAAELSVQAIRDSAEQWTNVASSSLVLVDGGIVDTVIGPEGPGDFSAENALSLLGRFNGGLTPIIIDSQDENGNGTGDLLELLGLQGANGVGSPEFVDGDRIIEGIIIINGARVDEDNAQSGAFRGTMTHEFGHLINLAHSVVNGQAVLFGGSDAVYPDGTPLDPGPQHVETMFPFSSSSGMFRFTPHADDIASISTLYPNPNLPLSGFGSIRGTLLSSDGIPLTGGQIIARNQAGDPLSEAVSAISGDFVQDRAVDHPLSGVYRLNTLTPGGRYSLEVRDTVAGGFSTDVYYIPALSSLFFPALPGPEEFYSGPEESSQSPPDDPSAPPFLIDVPAGGPEQAVQADLVFNHFTPPAHDLCENAIDIPLSQLPLEDVRSTQGATLGEGEPTCFFGLAETGSAWYRLRNDSPQAQTVFLTAVGDYTYGIQSFSGSCNSQPPAGDDCQLGSFFLDPQLILHLTPGQERLVRVASLLEGNPGGSLTLQLLPFAAPSNDTCQGARSIQLDDLPFQDSLDAATAFSEADQALSCTFSQSNSLWYEFSNDSAQPVDIEVSTRGSSYDAAMQLYSGACGMQEPLACDADSQLKSSADISFTAQPGVPYRLQVVAVDPPVGQLNFRLRRAPQAPPNDDCSDALPLLISDLPLAVTAETSQATNQEQEPITGCGSPFDPQQSRSVWYRFLNDRTLPLDVLLETVGSDFNTLLQVYRGSCAAFERVACDDFAGPDSTSRLVFRAEPGVEYWIKAASSGTEPGGELILQASLASQSTPSDLQVLLLDSQDRATARGQLDYRLGVFNQSQSDLSGASLRLDLSPSLRVIEASSSSGDCQPDSSALICPFGTLQPGQEEAIQMSLSPRSAGGVSITASAEWDQADPQSPRSLTFGAQVDPFLIFPANLNSTPFIFSDNSVPVPQPPATGPPSPFKDIFVGIALVNNLHLASTVAIEGLDALGMETFVNDPALVIEGFGQSALTTDQAGPLTEETAILAARGSELFLGGFFMVGDNSLEKLDGIGRRLSADRELFVPLAQQTADLESRLALFNPTLQPTDGISVELIGPGSEIVASVRVALFGNGTLIAGLDDLFGPGLAIEEGYLRVRSPQPLQGFEFIASSQSFAALAAQPAPAATRLIAPHFFVDDQGGQTIVRLYSAEDVALEVTGLLRGDSGEILASRELTLQPGEFLVQDVGTLFDVAPDAGEVLTGYMSFELRPQGFIGFRGPFSRVLASVEYSGGSRGFRSILPFLNGSTFFTRLLQVAQSEQLDIFTGLAIARAESLSPPTASVVVEAYDSQGQIVAQRTIEMGPRQRVIGLLNEEVFFGPDFELVGGHIEVNSSAPVVVFALFGDSKSRFLAAIEGQQ